MDEDIPGKKKRGRPRLPPGMKKPRKKRPPTGRPMGRPRKNTVVGNGAAINNSAKVNEDTAVEDDAVVRKDTESDDNTGSGENADFNDNFVFDNDTAVDNDAEFEDEDDIDVEETNKIPKRSNGSPGLFQPERNFEKADPTGLSNREEDSHEYQAFDWLSEQSTHDSDDDLPPDDTSESSEDSLSLNKKACHDRSRHDILDPSSNSSDQGKEARDFAIGHKSYESIRDGSSLNKRAHNRLIKQKSREFNDSSSRNIYNNKLPQKEKRSHDFGTRRELTEFNSSSLKKRAPDHSTRYDLSESSDDSQPPRTKVRHGRSTKENIGDGGPSQERQVESVEEHFEWLKRYDTSTKFDEFWSKADEVKILNCWYQNDEDMINAFASEEIPLWTDMKQLWGLTPDQCLPGDLEFSTKDNDLLDDGQQNRNMSAITCILLHTCLVLPAFRDALPFFQYMVQMAVYLRLRKSPYETKAPDEMNLLMKGHKVSVGEISKTVKSYQTRFESGGEANIEEAIRDLTNELLSSEISRLKDKKPNGYDHLAMRHELSMPSDCTDYEAAVTPRDLTAILVAWEDYAIEHDLQQPSWYRLKLESTRETSDMPSRRHWGRVKRNLFFSDSRRRTISRRKKEVKERKESRLDKTSKSNNRPPQVQLVEGVETSLGSLNHQNTRPKRSSRRSLEGIELAEAAKLRADTRDRPVLEAGRSYSNQENLSSNETRATLTNIRNDITLETTGVLSRSQDDISPRATPNRVAIDSSGQKGSTLSDSRVQDNSSIIAGSKKPNSNHDRVSSEFQDSGFHIIESESQCGSLISPRPEDQGDSLLYLNSEDSDESIMRAGSGGQNDSPSRVGSRGQDDNDATVLVAPGEEAEATASTQHTNNARGQNTGIDNLSKSKFINTVLDPDIEDISSDVSDGSSTGSYEERSEYDFVCDSIGAFRHGLAKFDLSTKTKSVQGAYRIPKVPKELVYEAEYMNNFDKE